MCKIVWRYQREEDSRYITQHLDQTIAAFDHQPYALLIDMRSIRYILPDDRRVFFDVYESLSSTPLETLYLVDIRNYHRMQLLISLNQFPNPDAVFKYEVEALEYIEQIFINKDHQDNPSSSDRRKLIY